MGRLTRALIGYPSKQFLEEKRQRVQRRDDQRAQRRELELIEEQNELLRDLLESDDD